MAFGEGEHTVASMAVRGTNQFVERGDDFTKKDVAALLVANDRLHGGERPDDPCSFGRPGFGDPAEASDRVAGGDHGFIGQKINEVRDQWPDRVLLVVSGHVTDGDQGVPFGNRLWTARHVNEFG